MNAQRGGGRRKKGLLLTSVLLPPDEERTHRASLSLKERKEGEKKPNYNTDFFLVHQKAAAFFISMKASGKERGGKSAQLAWEGRKKEREGKTRLKARASRVLLDRRGGPLHLSQKKRKGVITQITESEKKERTGEGGQ